MPHKSQRKPYQSRKPQNRPAASSVAVNVPPVSVGSQSTPAAPVVTKPKVSQAPAPNAEAALAAARYPFVASELKRIGILAGIILLILVVLSFVL